MSVPPSSSASHVPATTLVTRTPLYWVSFTPRRRLGHPGPQARLPKSGVRLSFLFRRSVRTRSLSLCTLDTKILQGPSPDPPNLPFFRLGGPPGPRSPCVTEL